MSALDKALDHSKNLGVDECEVVHIKRKILTVRITDSEIYELKNNFDENFGVRLIHDKKIASSQTAREQGVPTSRSSAMYKEMRGQASPTRKTFDAFYEDITTNKRKNVQAIRKKSDRLKVQRQQQVDAARLREAKKLGGRYQLQPPTPKGAGNKFTKMLRVLGKTAYKGG